MVLYREDTDDVVMSDLIDQRIREPVQLEAAGPSRCRNAKAREVADQGVGVVDLGEKPDGEKW